MGTVSGRWALILVIFSTAPTLVTHLMGGARWTTIVSRTCLAMFGSATVGFLLEWYVQQIKEQNKRQQKKGQHLDMKLGPDQDLVSAISSAPESDSQHEDDSNL